MKTIQTHHEEEQSKGMSFVWIGSYLLIPVNQTGCPATPTFFSSVAEMSNILKYLNMIFTNRISIGPNSVEIIHLPNFAR